ncbi:hypothetical protein TNCT_621931 [Trichonephila clavata]|uniref:Uncharacterized protein n=1 Tax=Trichonephila clavata TaxID=2740835 RepID=A0A8X6GZY8_TRICU|nr:hypothetical protein TNCT_621931 [Trichonephila clavata]
MLHLNLYATQTRVLTAESLNIWAGIAGYASHIGLYLFSAHMSRMERLIILQQVLMERIEGGHIPHLLRYFIIPACDRVPFTTFMKFDHT